MANLKFYKKSTAPASPAEGAIWFNTVDRSINVYTGSAWEAYSGVLDAKISDNVLTLTKADGTNVQFDFSDVASASAIATQIATLQSAIDGKLNAADQVVKSVNTAASAGVALAKSETGELSVSVTPGSVAEGDTSVVTGGAVAAAITEATKDIATSDVVSGLDARVAAIENDYLTHTHAEEAAEAVDALDAAIADEKSRAEGVEAGLSAQISDLSTTVAGNTAAINSILGNEDDVNLNSIAELAAWIEEHGTEAAGYAEAIAANAKAIEDQATSDVATYETKTDAATKLTEAKEYADGLNTAMDARVKELEAIDHSVYAKSADVDEKIAAEVERADAAYDASGSAADALIDAKTYTDAALTWAEFE